MAIRIARLPVAARGEAGRAEYMYGLSCFTTQAPHSAACAPLSTYGYKPPSLRPDSVHHRLGLPTGYRFSLRPVADRIRSACDGAGLDGAARTVPGFPYNLPKWVHVAAGKGNSFAVVWFRRWSCQLTLRRYQSSRHRLRGEPREPRLRKEGRSAPSRTMTGLDATSADRLMASRLEPTSIRITDASTCA